MPMISPTAQNRMQQSPGAGQSAEAIYGRNFAQMAQSSFAGAHPRENQYVQGFHVIQANPDEGVAMGAFVLQVGEHVVHVPAVLNKNTLSPFDVMLVKQSETFLPFTMDWIRAVESSAPGALGEAKKPPKTLASDVDIRNLVVPPMTGRYSYASAADVPAPLMDYLSRANNATKTAARAFFGKHPKLAQHLRHKHRERFDESLRAYKEAHVGLTEAPVSVFTPSDSAEAFRAAFGKNASAAYVQCQRDGYVLADVRVRTKIALATEGTARIVQVRGTGLYRLHLRDGSTRIAYVTDRVQSLDQQAIGARGNGHSVLGSTGGGDGFAAEASKNLSERLLILTDRGEALLWNGSDQMPVMELAPEELLSPREALQRIANSFSTGSIRNLREGDRYASESPYGGSVPRSTSLDGMDPDSPDEFDEETQSQIGFFARIAANGNDLEVSDPFVSLWGITSHNDEISAYINPTQSPMMGHSRRMRIHVTDDPSGNARIRLYGGGGTYRGSGESKACIPNSYMMLTGKQLDHGLVPIHQDEVRASINARMDKTAHVQRLHVDGGTYYLNGYAVGSLTDAVSKLAFACELSGPSIARLVKHAAARRSVAFRAVDPSALLKMAQDPMTQGAVAAPAPQSGQLTQDPNTGLLVDQATGQMFDPSTGQPVDPSMMGGQPGMAPGQPAPPPQPSPVEIAAQDVLTLLQAQAEEVQKSMEQQLMMVQGQAQAVQSILSRAQEVAQGAPGLDYATIRGMVAAPVAQPAQLDSADMAPVMPSMPPQGAPAQPGAPLASPTGADMDAALFAEQQELVDGASELAALSAIATSGQEQELAASGQLGAFLQAIDTAAKALLDLRLKQDSVIEQLGDMAYKESVSKLVKVIKLLGEVTLKLYQQSKLMDTLSAQGGAANTAT